MLPITADIYLDEELLNWQFVRASGPGGQHVNKVSTAVLLQLDIRQSGLPDWLQQRLLKLADHRISQSGKITIKCQQSRSQEQNRELALAAESVLAFYAIGNACLLFAMCPYLLLYARGQMGLHVAGQLLLLAALALAAVSLRLWRPGAPAGPLCARPSHSAWSGADQPLRGRRSWTAAQAAGDRNIWRRAHA